MTTDRKTKTDKPTIEPSESWLKSLVERLPLPKLTAAQTGNYVMDIIGLSYFGKYLASKPPPEYGMVVILVMLGIGAWCHAVSKPRRR